MLAEQRERVEKALADMIDDVYKTHLRKMQSDMHSCAANCCNDMQKKPDMENVQNCIEECAGPLLKAHDYVQHQLIEFQTHLQKCIVQCNNDVRSKIPSATEDSDYARQRYQYEMCTVKCVDKHIGLIPSMMRSMKTVLSNGSKTMI